MGRSFERSLGLSFPSQLVIDLLFILDPFYPILNIDNEEFAIALLHLSHKIEKGKIYDSPFHQKFNRHQGLRIYIRCPNVIRLIPTASGFRQAPFLDSKFSYERQGY